MNVSHQRHTIATRPPILTPAGRIWLCYAAALVAVAAWVFA